jgi:hypothetical protein
MSGFTKLVPEIVLSSIWNESAEVRCVWIAMLATKDQEGNVRGNAQSMARLANVSLGSVVEALAKFQAPDADSNTPDNDGRRIQAIPGGWHVLNHDLYRGRDYQEVEAARKREYRKSHKMSGTCPGQVTDPSASVSESSSDTYDREGGCKGETPAKTKEPACKPSSALPDWLTSLPGFTPELWGAWMETRRKKRAATSGHAVTLLLRKLEQRPQDAVAAIETAVEAGWQGFEWAWFDDRRPKAVPVPKTPAEPYVYKPPQEADEVPRYKAMTQAERDKVRAESIQTIALKTCRMDTDDGCWLDVMDARDAIKWLDMAEGKEQG